jgi:hypothetical protein
MWLVAVSVRIEQYAWCWLNRATADLEDILSRVLPVASFPERSPYAPSHVCNCPKGTASLLGCLSCREVWQMRRFPGRRGRHATISWPSWSRCDTKGEEGGLCQVISKLSSLPWQWDCWRSLASPERALTLAQPWYMHARPDVERPVWSATGRAMAKDAVVGIETEKESDSLNCGRCNMVVCVESKSGV